MMVWLNRIYCSILYDDRICMDMIVCYDGMICTDREGYVLFYLSMVLCSILLLDVFSPNLLSYINHWYPLIGL
jgi:hypothetical protein